MQKKLSSLVGLILSDRDTRNLFFFLLLNLLMAFVELFYGLMTNSLGLISDSFHMFFDCSALLLGLAASIISKRKPTEAFSYGFARAETLTGLANGLFLLFIALFIMKESIERTLEPPEVHHERLFVISVLGFIVNLIGIFVFQHGGQLNKHHSCSSHSHNHNHHHHHQHHDHNHEPAVHAFHQDQQPHSHSNNNHVHEHHYSHFSSPIIQSNNNNNHSNNNYDKQANGIVALDMNSYIGSPPESPHEKHNHNHDYNDHHHHHHHLHDPDTEPLVGNGEHSHQAKKSHRGQLMQSVLLHIIADTLGSVGVMISALLMSQFGWLIADPLCSMFIAILISISVYPLLRDSIFVLMQRVPVELDAKLPQCLNKIQNLPGVFSMHEVHFWTLNSDSYVGSLKLLVKPDANHRNILTNSKIFLRQIGVERAIIEIDQV